MVDDEAARPGGFHGVGADHLDVTGEEDDGDMGGGRVRGKLARRGEAVGARHGEVHDDDVWTAFSDNPQRGLRGASDAHVETPALEEDRVDQARVLNIVNDEHERRRMTGRGRERSHT